MSDSGAPRPQPTAFGDANTDALFTSLYSELRRVAKRELGRNGAPATLSPTMLLHEAYLDMAGRDSHVFPDEARFLGYAARVMRGLIIDYARSRQAIKRGGAFEITSLNASTPESASDAEQLTRISEALDELTRTDRELAELVDLKFFCGFSFLEIAAMRAVSERTVQRQWEKARIYLHHTLQTQLL